MPSRPVKALLAVEPGVDAEQVQESLPADDDFNVAAVVSGADEALNWLRTGAADLLLVACAGYSDRALLLLDAVARQNPDDERDGPRARVTERLPPARVRGRRRRHRDAPGNARAGALRGAQAARAKAGRRDAADLRALAARLRPRAQGRHGQDADRDQPLRLPRAARREGRAHRSRPPVRRRRPLPRAPARANGLRPRPVAGCARRRQARRVPGNAFLRREDADRAETARTRRAPSAPSSCARSTRSCARTTTG